MSPAARLEVGLILPSVEGGLGGRTPRWADLDRLAKLAEAIGFDAVWVWDHLLFRGPPSDRAALRVQEGASGTWECWSLVAGLAVATQRIQIGTFVLSNAFRNPALVAKMADTVDEISGGRLILGLGAGWNEAELRAFGYPTDHLVGRFEEGIAIIHALLRDGRADFDGRYYQVRDCELRPRGPTQGGPSIMIGTRSPRMLRIAARYADICNAWARTVEAAIELRAGVEAACVDVGRDPATLGRTHGVLIDFPDLPGYGGGRAPGLTGTPEQIATALGAYREAGVRHVQLSLDPLDEAALERLSPTIEAMRAS